MGFNEAYTKENYKKYMWKTTDDKVNKTDLIKQTRI